MLAVLLAVLLALALERELGLVAEKGKAAGWRSVLPILSAGPV